MECLARTLSEVQLQNLVLEAINKVLGGKQRAIKVVETNISEVLGNVHSEELERIKQQIEKQQILLVKMTAKRVTACDEQMVRKLIEKITVYDDHLDFRSNRGFRLRLKRFLNFKEYFMVSVISRNGGDRMKELIAYCGLDCEKCNARIATLNNDDELREKTAKLWSKLNGADITAKMINCVGCRVDGVKTPFCDAMCPIRKCAVCKKVVTCGECDEMDQCVTLGTITSNNAQTLENISSNRSGD